MAKLYDLARMTTATAGTGTITLASAVSGYLTFIGAGASDGDIISYGVLDGTNSEVGTGTLGSSCTTLTRNVNKSTNTNNAISLSGSATVYITSRAEDLAPTGNVNKLRNSSLSSWFNGSASRTITVSGAWGAEGIYIVPTGASVTSARNANGVSPALSYFSQLITGATSVTDVTVRFVVESYDAQSLVGQQVTFQVPVLNNTGASITPTITVKHAATQDATYSTTDVSAASLQTIANGASGVLAYSWLVPAGGGNGLSINIDFGNNFSTTGKSIQIGGGFDLRATPSSPTGVVASPPTPEIRNVADDVAWNSRFFQSSYPNGTAPATITTSGQAEWVFSGTTATGTASFGINVQFVTRMRATPSMTGYSPLTGTVNRFVDAFNTDQPPTISAGDTSFTWAGTQTGSTTTVNVRMQWTADATLIGG